MYNVITNRKTRPAGTLMQLIVLCLATSVFFACKKEAVLPQEERTAAPVGHSDVSQITVMPKLRLSVSSIILLQGNATTNAVTFNWSAFPGASNQQADSYVIEAGTAGSQFSEPVEIGYTNQLSINFTVQELNKQLLQLIITGSEEVVEFRIRLKRGNTAALYSDGIALSVTTYQPFTEYSDAQTFRVPGNFEGWKPATAPKSFRKPMTASMKGLLILAIPTHSF